MQQHRNVRKMQVQTYYKTDVSVLAKSYLLTAGIHWRMNMEIRIYVNAAGVVNVPRDAPSVFLVFVPCTAASDEQCYVSRVSV